MSELNIDLSKTALVVIDEQKGIALRDGLVPYSGTSVIEKTQQIAEKLKNTDALIVLVHVKNYGPEALSPITDAAPLQHGPIPDAFSEFALPIASDAEAKNVIEVAKHNWGAFYGTDLDVQLRRRGIDTIILTGVATSIGVDTTAREAYSRNYNQIIVSDAVTDMTQLGHDASIKVIFPRIAKVRSTQEVLDAL
jgi:nicotinamidase-related amidase